MKDWQMRGKERSPRETIDKAEQILKKLGLKTKIEEISQDLADCYSCRLTLDGIAGGQIGTNGKGMTAELSHASAYGEMMERLSNRIFLPFLRPDDENIEDCRLKDAPLYAPSDSAQPGCVLSFIKTIAKTVKAAGIFSNEVTVQMLLEELAPDKLGGKFSALPFYSLREEKTVYIPDWLIAFLGSNGLAAGNTIEEALVEGISEIIERYCFLQLMENDIVMPQIPREFLKNFPHIEKMIEEIELRGNYAVRVLDASLGKGLPCVCGVITDKDTGRFGLKFGSQPNIAVALERIFTEALQGGTLKIFCGTQTDFFRTEAARRTDNWNGIKTGSFNAPARFLMNTPSYHFNPWGTETKSNRQRAVELIRLLESLGGDVYIRDASYLGFPSVNVYAAGVSEVRPLDCDTLASGVLNCRVMKYFRRIDRLNEKEVEEIAKYAASKRGSTLDNKINVISGLPFAEEVPGGWYEADFLYAVCLWRLERKRDAANVFKYIARGLASANLDETGYYKAVELYTAGVASGEKEEKVFEVVCNLCPSKAEAVRETFINPATVLKKIYPVCGDAPCGEITAGGCMYGDVHELYKKLVAAENANPQSLEYIRALAKECH